MSRIDGRHATIIPLEEINAWQDSLDQEEEPQDVIQYLLCNLRYRLWAEHDGYQLARDAQAACREAQAMCREALNFIELLKQERPKKEKENGD